MFASKPALISFLLCIIQDRSYPSLTRRLTRGTLTCVNLIAPLSTPFNPTCRDCIGLKKEHTRYNSLSQTQSHVVITFSLDLPPRPHINPADLVAAITDLYAWQKAAVRVPQGNNDGMDALVHQLPPLTRWIRDLEPMDRPFSQDSIIRYSANSKEECGGVYLVLTLRTQWLLVHPPQHY